MTSPVSLPAGSKITAAKLDAYENLTGVWQSFAATFTATTTNPTNFTVTARYIQVGKLVVYAFLVVCNAGFTGGTGGWRLTAPVAVRDTGLHVGTLFLYDDSTAANRKSGVARFASATVLQFHGDTGDVDANNPFVWAQNDQLRGRILYEAA